MTVAEKKINLIRKISNEDNPVLLDEIMQLIEINEKEVEYTFSDLQKESISIAREQLLTGDYLSHKEALKQANKWLEE